MTAPLQVTDVSKSFDGRLALDHVSLELRDGEVLGLLGPNGAGKSTLIRTIMGRVKPDTGMLTIFGQQARPGDPTSRIQIGFVPQEVAIYPLLSSRENLLVFGRYLGMKGKQLEEAVHRSLAWSALEDRANDPTRTLSGGMKRRLNIAAGVIHEPRILLLDEPTVGVDPQSRERIYEMIINLRSSGVSMIYTTHYMEEAEKLCDRVAIIDHGRIIALGTREQLVEGTIGSHREVTMEFDRPLDPQVQADLTAGGARINSTHLVMSTARPADDMTRVLKVLEQHQVAVLDVTLRAPTLEDVFLRLTGRELRE